MRALAVTQRSNLPFGWKEIAVALLGAITFIEVNIVGRLFVPEIVLLFVLVFAATTNNLHVRKQATLIGLMAIWFIGQVLTDITRGTESDDFLRGWARIAFFLTNFVGLSILLSDRRSSMFSYLAGFAASGIIAYIYLPSEYALSFPFKFGYGPSLAIFAVLLSWYLRALFPLQIGISITPVVLVSVLSILQGARSQGLILLLCAAVTYSKSRLSRVKSTPLKAGILILTAIAGVSAVYFLYSALAVDGYLGQEERDKYLLESSGELGLISGRAEIFSSLRAIRDAPIIGHGSWAKNAEYVLYLQDVLASYGVDMYYDETNNVIPTHSHLFGSWVEAGIFGAICWAYVLYFIGKCCSRVMKSESSIDVLVLYIIILMSWDILFSPFGAERRLIEAFNLVVLSAYLTGAHRGEIVHRWVTADKIPAE
jgi:hypothetical protein